MSATILNQSAAFPLALAEAFHAIARAQQLSAPLTEEDARFILGAEDWQRILQDEKKFPELRKDWEQFGSAEFLTANSLATWNEIMDCELQLGASSGLSAGIHLARQLAGCAMSSKRKTALEQTEKGRNLLRLHEAAKTLHAQLNTHAADLVLRELVNLGAVEKREEILYVHADWEEVIAGGFTNEKFYERLVRYLFRALDPEDQDYRLFADTYRWWMKKVAPDRESGALTCLHRSPKEWVGELFQEQQHRLKTPLNPTKAGCFPAVVAELGLGWQLESEQFRSPLPDPSALLAWALDSLLKPQETLTLVEFVEKLGRRYPQLNFSAESVLPFGLSFALRALHDDQRIELAWVEDAKSRIAIWEDTSHKVRRANRVRRVS